MSIQIARSEIEEYAFALSKLRKTYEQFIWMLAEVELCLQRNGSAPNELIGGLAKEIQEQSPEIEDVHWLIAEKRLLCSKKYNHQLPRL